ncbi:MAG TPA: ribosome silencing factor [Acidimicrobiales bacterium]|nr:ribosome silencing factor [Acidimicrobiales bacterium]
MPVLTRPNPTEASPALALEAARAAADKKATDPVILDVSQVLGLCDYFVIASAPNDRLVRAICEEIEERVKRAGGNGPRSIEGLDDARWVLMDFGDLIAHIFLDEAREFYDLERLWGDVPRVPFED